MCQHKKPGQVDSGQWHICGAWVGLGGFVDEQAQEGPVEKVLVGPEEGAQDGQEVKVVEPAVGDAIGG